MSENVEQQAEQQAGQQAAQQGPPTMPDGLVVKPYSQHPEAPAGGPPQTVQVQPQQVAQQQVVQPGVVPNVVPVAPGAPTAPPERIAPQAIQTPAHILLTQAGFKPEVAAFLQNALDSQHGYMMAVWIPGDKEATTTTMHTHRENVPSKAWCLGLVKQLYDHLFSMIVS